MLRDLYVVATLFLRNLRHTYVLTTLLYNYVKTLPNTAKIYLFKINNRDTRKRSDICFKLTINLPERRH